MDFKPPQDCYRIRPRMIPSITSKSIGKDHPSWVEVTIERWTSRLLIFSVHMFADISYMPNFIIRLDEFDGCRGTNNYVSRDYHRFC